MRARSLLLVAALAVLVTACHMDATVTVRMRADGSGRVSVRVALDADAVRAAEVAGGKLADRVRLTDLTAAGWRVSPWTRSASGGAVLTVSKAFADPAEVAGIVAEINGAHGPLRGVAAHREAATFSTRWTVDGAVDLRTVEPAVGDDPELVAGLTAAQVDVTGIEQRLRDALGGLRVHLTAELPGTRDSVAAGVGHRATLHATADDTALGRVVLLGLGVLAGLVAITLIVVGELRGRRRRPASP